MDPVLEGILKKWVAWTRSKNTAGPVQAAHQMVELFCWGRIIVTATGPMELGAPWKRTVFASGLAESHPGLVGEGFDAERNRSRVEATIYWLDKVHSAFDLPGFDFILQGCPAPNGPERTLIGPKPSSRLAPPRPRSPTPLPPSRQPTPPRQPSPQLRECIFCSAMQQEVTTFMTIERVDDQLLECDNRYISIKCTMCWELFKVTANGPVNLVTMECDHVVCIQCHDQLSNEREGRRRQLEYICPVCRQPSHTRAMVYLS
jgi:hypothetical protein